VARHVATSARRPHHLDGSPVEKHYVVLEGELTLVSELNGVQTEAVLHKHDSARFAPGEKRQLVNRSNRTAMVLLAMAYPTPA
jgi:mannose-6-phosphate isomerase-like protein (cupin superfamily)